ncbi:MAG TPA: hypothetical protein VE422_15055 [Terriglobia bacterium]|nr:hypothetical protein [Terriglobia bacterium]
MTGNTQFHHPDRVVQDYSTFSEKDKDPFLQKTIRKLLIADARFIVYLDEDLGVQWAFTDNYGDLPPAYSDIVSKVAYLEALAEPILVGQYRQTFQTFLAEVIKYVLESNNHPARAYALLDRAEKYFVARNRELARLWYLKGASVALLGILVAGFTAWFTSTRASTYLFCGAAGALGAWLSVVLPSNTVLDAHSGPRVLNLEGVVRIFLGTVAALLLTLATQANILLGIVATSQSMELLIMLSIVAGASERLVPSLIKQIEEHISVRDLLTEQKDTQPSPENNGPTTKGRSRRSARHK